MSLVLERGDLLQLEPISNRGTLKLLPLGKKNKQKLIIGDDSGQIFCYEFKKGEPQIVFQARPFEGPITCIALGGNPQKRDKIFISHSQRIVGLTKKGAPIFKLTSSLTETIQNIAVEGTKIWTGCECIYNLFDNGKDVALYAAKDQINDLVVGHLIRSNDYDTVLACQDNCIRIVQGSQLFLEIPTPSPVVALAMMDQDMSSSLVTSSPKCVVFALATGALGLVQVFNSATYNISWLMEDTAKVRSPITCIKIFDLNKDKVLEIIVGRDDGRIEVFRFQQDTFLAPPTKLFSKDIGESIRSVECGVVNTVDYNEIILVSYSGKVISFTTEPVLGRAAEDNYGRSIQTINNENRIKHMRKEVDDLKAKVVKEREKVRRIQQTGHANNSIMIPVQDFSVISTFKLDVEIAAYILLIELQSPIDLIIIRSPVALDLIDTDGTSVLSVTPPHLQPVFAGEEALGKFVAVFRCQSAEKRLSLTLRTNEGEYGDMTVTIVAASQPKAAKILKYTLKPLSLNTKVHQLQSSALARPRNRVKYTGNVPMSTIHEWVQSIFPDIPPRLDENAGEERYYFRNTFTGAFSVCEFRKNEIVFESESASTVAIAKENVTRLANYRRIPLEETMNTNDASIGSFLSLIRPKLDHQLSLSRKMQLVDAVQEIAMQEGDLSWMSEEYSEILRNQETIRREFKNRDKSVDYLAGIVTDLFVDWNKLQGLDGRSKLKQLSEVVMAGEFDQMVSMFTSTSISSRK